MPPTRSFSLKIGLFYSQNIKYESCVGNIIICNAHTAVSPGAGRWKTMEKPGDGFIKKILSCELLFLNLGV